MRYAHVIGWGMAVPDQVLTNDDLARMVDTSDEWIVSRTGIRQRRIAGPRDTTASLATQAARKALEMANVSPLEIELIVVATSSPEHLFPATACLVQDALGAARAGAFDLSAACTGFIYALGMASQPIRLGAMDTVLVIGAETLSRLVNWQDRATCILFGDGAGAFVLRGSDTPGGVLSFVMRSDGSGGDLLLVPAGGSKMPASHETVRDNLHTISMDGKGVFRFATRAMAQVSREAASKAGIALDDVDMVIPHQANRRIIESAARALGLPEEKFFINVDRYGNTSTASIPIALCEAVNCGRVRPNDRLIFVGFGAGLTWGAAVVHWEARPPTPVSRWQRARRRALYGLAKVRSSLRRAGRRLEGMLYGKQAPEGVEPPHIKSK